MVSSGALSAAPRTTPLFTAAGLLWFASMVALAVWLLMRTAGEFLGMAGLVPPEHHPPAGSHVRISLVSEVAEEAWPQVVDLLGPTLPGHWPLAPPPAETRAWLDAHLLYRLAPVDQAALARRLEPAALRAVVAGLHARMASPLFAVGDEDPRRDPLGLRSLSEVEPARLGLLAGDGPVATPAGDLVSADGRTLLLYLRTGLSATRLHAWIGVQLAARFGVTSGVEVVVLPMAVDAASSALSASSTSSASSVSVADLLAAGLAALTLVLALGLRRVRVALALVLVVGAGVPLVLLLAGGIDPLAAPLLLTLLGVAASCAPPVGDSGRSSTLRLALALLPLLLLPYPVWQRWAVAWVLGGLALVFAAVVVTPPLLRLAAARPAPLPVLRATRSWPLAVGLLTMVACLSVGTWSLGHVSGAMLTTDRGDGVSGEFFAPARMAELRTSPAVDDAAALAAAVDDAAVLAPLVPAAAVRLDAPGGLLLADGACATRAAQLVPLDLPGRVDLLRVILSEQGMRPDAFGEFLRALDAGRQPTPAAALAGPLASWFTAHLERDESGVTAVSRVQLADPLPADTLLPPGLRGPAVFAHHEQQARLGRLALALALGAWLAAFLTWLGARSFAVALTSAIVGLAAQAGALGLAVAAGISSVPLLLPPLLLVGAITADASARCCQADGATRPVLTFACQLSAAPVLLVSADPQWRGFGLLLGLGGVLGFALATRAAPPICAWLRRLLREEAAT